MKVRGIECSKCHDFIWSNNRHDFKRCKCKTTGIDGGIDYIKIIGPDVTNFKTELREVPDDPKSAWCYVDWNEN